MAKRISAADFVAFLEARLAAKDGYIFGTQGEDPNQLSDWYFTGQYSGEQLQMALYWRANAQRVWDCNGLAEGYYKDVTGTNIDAQARDNYSDWCDPRGSGAIPAQYRVPGAAVFKKSSYIHHVGFLEKPVAADNPEGDWYVIEARGVMYGVIRSVLSDNNWNCWGLMTKYFDYGSAESATEISADGSALGGRLLKSGTSGDDVRQLQQILISLGYSLPKYGADGQFGSETEAAVRKLQAALGVSVDGMYGEKTHAALMSMLERKETQNAQSPSETTEKIRVTAEVSAYVRSGPGTGYSILAVAMHGAEFASPAAASNGWRSVEVNGAVGWISPEMCEVI